jgi:glycosyltransferase involved in cell wall biosynthesis
VATANFAGVERYVCDVAVELAKRGCQTTVIGGDPNRMPTELGTGVAWLSGATPKQAFASLLRVGPLDICHAHMTHAEGVAVALRLRHGAPIVSTRHFARPRGTSRPGRLLAGAIGRRLHRQIAVSDFVARRLERPPDAVIRNGVRPRTLLWNEKSRVVLVLQRLEPEKETLVALQAWQRSGLHNEGWSLRIVGEGTERQSLEDWCWAGKVQGVAFAGWSDHVSRELRGAGLLLAPSSNDSFGFAVVEAMSVGVPVVACAAGGHLETLASVAGCRMFPPGDALAAASALRTFLPAASREEMSTAQRNLVREEFSLSRHVDRIVEQYTLLGVNEDR